MVRPPRETDLYPAVRDFLAFLDLHEPDESSTAHSVQARVDEDSIQPAIESGHVLERPASPPSAGHCFLGRILGLGGIAKQVPGQRVAAVESAFAQALESGIDRLG